MNKLALIFVFLGSLFAADPLDEYLLKFDYAKRNAMKIKSYEALSGKAVFVDIRFKEEYGVRGDEAKEFVLELTK